MKRWKPLRRRRCESGSVAANRSVNKCCTEWNETRQRFPSEQCVHELFEEQVERTPEAVAVVYEDEFQL